ncbi:MAG: hypothetical protein JSS57_16635 [Proteobacteria bacterium]|nr:hypothetical protein [Pseudomonadota bacterium]
MIRELRLILWFVLGMAFSVNAVLAFADGVCGVDHYEAIWNGKNYKSGSELCSAYAATVNPTWNVYFYKTNDAGDGQCKSSTTVLVQVVMKAYCANGSAATTGPTGAYQCECPGPCASRGGQSVDDGTIDFGDGANKKLSMSFPARSDDNYVGQTFCSGGCTAAVDREVGSAGMTVDGSYYGQFSAKYSGQSCPTGEAAASPKTTPALIPKNTAEYDCIASGMGYGYVGSTVKCVAKTSSKETETKSTQTTNADGTRTTVNKTDSTVCASGVCTTTTTTTTTQYNSSGTATGTSITSETTTKADPNSGLGTGGAGNGQQQQGAECGIAGKPPCGVKVDETGVESDVAAVDQSAKQKIIAAYDEVKQKMEEVTRPQNWGVTWVYQPPAGACSVLQYGVTAHQFSINVCKPLGYIRDLWSYVIYVMTGLYIWRSARDAMNIV